MIILEKPDRARVSSLRSYKTRFRFWIIHFLNKNFIGYFWVLRNRRRFWFIQRNRCVCGDFAWLFDLDQVDSDQFASWLYSFSLPCNVSWANSISRKLGQRLYLKSLLWVVSDVYFFAQYVQAFTWTFTFLAIAGTFKPQRRGWAAIKSAFLKVLGLNFF